MRQLKLLAIEPRHVDAALLAPFAQQLVAQLAIDAAGALALIPSLRGVQTLPHSRRRLERFTNDPSLVALEQGRCLRLRPRQRGSREPRGHRRSTALRAIDSPA